MTIRRGEAWGSEVSTPPALRLARDDAELASLIDRDPSGHYGVVAGDLHRTVGHPEPGRPSAWRLPIDVLEVHTESTSHLAVAHVTIRRSWWRGPIVFVCNVDHVGLWNVAPRAHPNDGRFDVVQVDAAMALRDRWEFRRRLPTARHIPHPSVAVSTASTWTWTDDSGARVRVDGVDIGARTSVEVSIVPDAACVYV